MIKCAECGLGNPDSDLTCARCGKSLEAARLSRGIAATANEAGISKGHSVRKILFASARRIISLVLVLLFVAYLSLVTTSNPVSAVEQEKVNTAIELLERKGFGSEAFMLRYLTRFRGSDNWWNQRVGHASAYAATNFPFFIVTLYPTFFAHTIDDTERAVILLHEAYHLKGYGEEKATEFTWKEKRNVGWTKEEYAQTPVWNSIKEGTYRYAPHMFQCGDTGTSDCVE